MLHLRLQRYPLLAKLLVVQTFIGVRSVEPRHRVTRLLICVGRRIRPKHPQLDRIVDEGLLLCCLLLLLLLLTLTLTLLVHVNVGLIAALWACRL